MNAGLSQNWDNPWIDISIRLHDGMVHWPEDPAIRIKRIMDIEKGDVHTLSELCMGAHSGTHIDAPSHFLRGGVSIDKMPIDACIGEARVIQIEDSESIKPEELSAHDIESGERILFKTKNSERVWKTGSFVQDFVHLTSEAAGFLAERHVRVVGIDYLSVGGYKHGAKAVHETLMNGGIWIIEGLDLSQVRAGKYELVCLPLKIADGEGAPARAVLRALDY